MPILIFVYSMQPLPNFVILDMCGNPVAKESDNYRLFVVYHLKSLKALDGSAVVRSDDSSQIMVIGVIPQYLAQVKVSNCTL